jgi:hypothetical protein
LRIELDAQRGMIAARNRSEAASMATRAGLI